MSCEQDQSLHLGNIFSPACKLQTGVVVRYSNHINVTDVRAAFLIEPRSIEYQMILVIIHYSAMITFVSPFFYHSLVGRRSNILDTTSVDIMYVT